MIKNKLKLGLAVGLSMLVMSVSSAFAANLNWSNDTNVTLNASGSRTYVIANGSAASAMTVGSSTLSVTVPSGSTFTLESFNRDAFTNDSNIAQTCTNSLSSDTITGTGQTVVFTASATACTAPSGGLGSGGSSGSGSTSASDTTAPVGSILINNGASVTNSTAVTLTLSATDASGVSSMEISNDANFTGSAFEGYMTTKAWALTSGDGAKTVYAKFRDAVGNTSAAVSASITLNSAATVVPVPPPAPSPVPLTNDQLIAQLQAQINALILQINALVAAQGGAPVPGCPVMLTLTLVVGSNNTQVTCLQHFLSAQGHFHDGFTTHFGPLTLAAVKEFQLKWNITYAGGPGYGTVGPKTRAKINAMLGF